MSFRRPDLIFDGIREKSKMVFVLIHLMCYCEWGFFMHLLVGSPVSVDCFSVGQPRLKKRIFSMFLCLFDERQFSRFL